MSDRPEQQRLDPVRCPHCEEITMPNLLADGSAVCSCTAERVIPEVGLPAPMDDPVPPAGDAPRDHGQFGQDPATERFRPL